MEVNGIKRLHVGLEDQKGTPSTSSKEANSTIKASTQDEELMGDRRVERCQEEKDEEESQGYVIVESQYPFLLILFDPAPVEEGFFSLVVGGGGGGGGW